MVHGVDQLVLIVDQDILPDSVIGLDQVQVHPVEKVLLSFQQSVGLGKECPHQFTGGGVAGVDDKGQLLDLFALPAFQWFNKRQIAVHRKTIGVKIQVELVRVQLDLLPQHAEPAQEVSVAAAAAVGGLHLLFQGVGPFPGFFVSQVQLGLHPFPDLLPGLLGQRGGHLLGLFRGVLRPQAVVIGHEFQFQLAQHAGRLAGEPPVRRGRRHYLFFGGDLLIRILPHIGQGPLDTGTVQTVDHVFHRDVTGQAPQLRLPAAFEPQMAEYTMEYHMQIQPVEILRVLLVKLQQPGRLVVQHLTVGGQHPAALIRGRREGREGHIQKAEVQIQPAAHHG